MFRHSWAVFEPHILDGTLASRVSQAYSETHKIGVMTPRAAELCQDNLSSLATATDDLAQYAATLNSSMQSVLAAWTIKEREKPVMVTASAPQSSLSGQDVDMGGGRSG